MSLKNKYKLTEKLMAERIADEAVKAGQAGVVQGLQMALRIAKHWYGSEIPVQVFDNCRKATLECKTWAEVDEAIAKVVAADKVNQQLTADLLSKLPTEEGT